MSDGIGELDVSVVRAAGSRIWDERGRAYLDLTAGSGVLALGHGHPAVAAAMHAQIEAVVHGGWQLTTPARGHLTEQLLELLPWPDPMLLYCTTGSEAVEGALKIARAATGRRQVLGHLGGYHGKTAGSLGVTAKASFRADVTEVPVAGLSLPYPSVARYLTPAEEPTTGLDVGQNILEHPDFGRDDVAGIVVETVQGAGGMVAGAPGLLTTLRELTTRHGSLLVVDEIFTGFGRTGPMFSIEHERVVPDLMVLGKALGGGLPLALVAGPRHIMETLPALRQTSTFSANPVACAAGSAVLEALRDPVTARSVVRVGARIAEDLAGIDVPGVSVEVTGRGLMLGARITACPAASCGTFTRAVLTGMRERGVLALRGGATGDVVKWTPPLTLSSQEADESVDAFREAVRDAAALGEDVSL